MGDFVKKLSFERGGLSRDNLLRRNGILGQWNVFVIGDVPKLLHSI